MTLANLTIKSANWQHFLCGDHYSIKYIKKKMCLVLMKLTLCQSYSTTSANPLENTVSVNPFIKASDNRGQEGKSKYPRIINVRQSARWRFYHAPVICVKLKVLLKDHIIALLCSILDIKNSLLFTDPKDFGKWKNVNFMDNTSFRVSGCLLYFLTCLRQSGAAVERR